MFDATLADGPRADRRRVMPFSLALALHTAALGSILVCSYLILENVVDPDFSSVRVLEVLVVPPSSPTGDPAPVAPRPRATKAIEPPEEIVQPVAIPEAIPATAPAPETGVGPVDEGDGPGGGDPRGVPGGSGEGSPGLPGGGEGWGAGAAPIAIGPAVRPPELLVKVRPEYPQLARAARLQGRVILTAVIGTEGHVEDVEVAGASSPVFTQAAIEAVRQWRYRPALRNGTPVRVYFTVVVQFVLQ